MAPELHVTDALRGHKAGQEAHRCLQVVTSEGCDLASDPRVTIQYPQKCGGSGGPLKIHTVVISTQHVEPPSNMLQEVAGYPGSDARHH